MNKITTLSNTAVTKGRTRRLTTKILAWIAVSVQQSGLGCSDVSRRAKIVCTLGPATATPEKLRDLVEAGMDVARLNFSHGSHADHKQVYDMVRQAADDAGRAVGILAD